MTEPKLLTPDELERCLDSVWASINDLMGDAALEQLKGHIAALEALTAEMERCYITYDAEGDPVCAFCATVQVERDWHKDYCAISRLQVLKKPAG